ncbi:MAG: 30S ribosomal protein S6e [Candidatus Woesearchaeota archaeon]
MVEFKLSIADPKNKKTYKKEVKDKEATIFLGKKIGDIVEIPSLPGYKFQITGGSDYAGFPMRADISGPVRKRICSGKSVGFRIKGKGKKVRKTVCGNTIHPKIVQINLKILEYGTKPIEEKKEESTNKE